MGKRLFIINLILLILVIKFPVKEKNLEIAKEIKPQEIKNEQVITSRSLEEKRHEQIEPKIILATEISQDCIDLIKQFEGFKDTAYKLKGEDNYTIGYGHSDKHVYEGQTITKESAERLLQADLKGYADLVLKHCEYLELNQNELDALVSFTYNGGLGMLKQLTADGTRNKEEIAEHITAYTKSSSESNRKGLLKRRNAEKNLFLGGTNNEEIR